MATTSDAAPPALDGAFISGNLMDFHQNPVELMTRAAKLGDVVRLRFLHMKAYQLSHPDAIKATLLASGGAIVKGRAVEAFRPLVGRGVLLAEGEAHRKQRRMMQPAFHHHRVARYAEDMVREATLSLGGDPRVAAFDIEIENLESIHNHSAYARVTRPALQLR